MKRVSLIYPLIVLGIPLAISFCGGDTQSPTDYNSNNNNSPCTIGTQRCAPSAAAIEACSAGSWTAIVDCAAAAQTCVPTPTLHCESRLCSATPTAGCLPLCDQYTTTGCIPACDQYTTTGCVTACDEYTTTGCMPACDEYTTTGCIPACDEYTTTGCMPLCDEYTSTGCIP